MEPKETLRVQRIILADRMHWTLDYIESLDSEVFGDVLTVIDALDKARAFKANQR